MNPPEISLNGYEESDEYLAALNEAAISIPRYLDKLTKKRILHYFSEYYHDNPAAPDLLDLAKVPVNSVIAKEMREIADRHKSKK